jgi:hypothetical protein
MRRREGRFDKDGVTGANRSLLTPERGTGAGIAMAQVAHQRFNRYDPGRDP